MPDEAQAMNEKPAGEASFTIEVGRAPAWALTVLAIVVLAGVAVRCIEIGGPVVGYHAFNEAFYLDLGRQYLGKGLFAAWTSPLDLNNPPVYPFLLRIVFAFSGVSIAAARLLSVAAAAATSVALFFLGRRLYGDVAGLVAATVMALAPGSVLVGRNIQIDSVLALVTTLATLAWVVSARSERPASVAASGALAGLALVTKLQGAVLAPSIAAAEMFRTRSVSVLWSKRMLGAFAGFAAVGLPWHLVNVVRQSGYASSQSRLAEMARLPDAHFFDALFAREYFWLLSPPLFVAVIVGLGYLAWRHRPSDVLVLALFLGNVAFYLAYHHHTYYLYNSVPFAALAVGALAGTMRLPRPAMAVVPLALALVLAPWAVTMLLGKKVGYWSAADFVARLERAGVDPRHTTLGVERPLRGSWGPALQMYAGGMHIVSNPLEPGETIHAGDNIATLHSTAPAVPSDFTFVQRMPDVHTAPVILGYAPDQGHDAVFYFAMQDPSLVRVGPWYRFGTIRKAVPGPLYLCELSPSFAERVSASQPSTPTP